MALNEKHNKSVETEIALLCRGIGELSKKVNELDTDMKKRFDKWEQTQKEQFVTQREFAGLLATINPIIRLFWVFVGGAVLVGAAGTAKIFGLIPGVGH